MLTADELLRRLQSVGVEIEAVRYIRTGNAYVLFLKESRYPPPSADYIREAVPEIRTIAPTAVGPVTSYRAFLKEETLDIE